MPAITLDQAQAQLAAYLAAEEKLLTGGQSATLPNGNQLTLAELSQVQAGIKLWESRVNALEQTSLGRRRCRNVSPGW